MNPCNSESSVVLYLSVNPLLHIKCVPLERNLSASWWQRIILLLLGVCLLLDPVAGNTAAPSGQALFHVIHCYGHLIPGGLLPASHSSRWLVRRNRACPDERWRCQGGCRAHVLPHHQDRAPGNLCSPPACLASGQITDCGRHLLSYTFTKKSKKKKKE